MLDPDIPLDFAVIGFPGNRLTGEIATEIHRLVDQGCIRVVDIIYIAKDADGGSLALELNELPEDLYRRFAPFEAQRIPAFTPEDVTTLAASVPNDCGGLIVLWQNLWVRAFREAVAAAQGVVLVHERIAPEVVAEVAAEMAVEPD